VIRPGEFGVFFTGGCRPYSFHKFGCSSFGAVGVVGSMKAVEDEHGGDHVLDAVVSVGEVVHGLVLLVDDADAGFMCADDNGFDIFCCLTPLLESGVNLFRSFDGGLGVEFGW